MTNSTDIVLRGGHHITFIIDFGSGAVVKQVGGRLI